MENWLLFSMISFACWCFWGFLPKLAVRTIRPESVFILEMAGAVIIGIFIAAFFGIKFEPYGFLISFIAGASSYIGIYFYIKALKMSPVGFTSTITGIYPVVTAILAILILKETPSTRQIIGIALAVIAIILISWPIKKPRAKESR